MHKIVILCSVAMCLKQCLVSSDFPALICEVENKDSYPGAHGEEQ